MVGSGSLSLVGRQVELLWAVATGWSTGAVGKLVIGGRQVEVGEIVECWML